MKRITLGLVICLFFSQCVEIFDGDFTSSGSDRIVITGGITNLEPPEVRIYTSVAFADKDKAPGPVNDAQVWIEDQDGLKIEMRVANDVHERKLVFLLTLIRNQSSMKLILSTKRPLGISTL